MDELNTVLEAIWAIIQAIALVLVLISLLFGYMGAMTMRDRGHDTFTGFLLGFFLWLPGVIITILVSDSAKKIAEEHVKALEKYEAMKLAKLNEEMQNLVEDAPPTKEKKGESSLETIRTFTPTKRDVIVVAIVFIFLLIIGSQADAYTVF